MALTKITTEVIEDGAITSAKLGSGSVSAASLTGITTDNVSEGSTNVYYTDTRARSSVSVTGGNLSYDSGTGVIQLTTDTIRGAISVTDAGGDGSLAYSAGVITYTGPSAAETRAHFSGSTGISYNSSTGAFTTSAIPNASLSNSSITINSNSVDLGASVTLDTDDVGEGSTNLYYTDARVGTYISGNRTYGNITTTGYLAGPATFTIDPAAVGDNTGTVVIAGNLQVDGTTTTINSTTMTVDDLNIVLASGAANAAAANGAGITVDGASATLTYSSTGDSWEFNKDVIIGVNDTTPGALTIYGGATGNAEGAEIRLHTGADHDTTYDHYRIDVYQDDFRIGRAGQSDFYIFDNGLVKAENNFQAGGSITATDLKTTAQASQVWEAPSAASGNTEEHQMRVRWNATNDRWFLVPFPESASLYSKEFFFNFATSEWVLEGSPVLNASGLHGSPNITVGTIDSGAISSSGAITSTSGVSRFQAGLAIGSDDDIYFYPSATNEATIRTGTTGAYKYFTFESGGNLNLLSGGLEIGSTEVIDSSSNITSSGTITAGSGGSVGAPIITFSGDTDTGIYRTAANQLAFSTAGTQALKLDGLQNATFAGTITSNGLTVNSSEVLFDNTGGDFTLKLNTNAVGDKNEIIMGDTGTPLAKFGVGGTANDIITGSDGQDFNIGTSGGGRAINFSTDNYASVEMKLDGGTLTVAKTNTDRQTVGHEFRDIGFARHTRDDNYPLELVRLNSDGDLLKFYKDGAEVGSIETQGSEICLMSGTGGIRVRSGASSVIPVNASRTNLDNTTDLGSSSARFKDAYFAGSISSGTITSSGDFISNRSSYPGGRLFLGRTTGSPNAMTSAEIHFEAYGNNTTLRTLSKIEGRNTGYDDGEIRFYTESSGTLSEALTLADDKLATFYGNIDAGSNGIKANMIGRSATSSSDANINFWDYNHATFPGHVHIVADQAGSDGTYGAGQVMFWNHDGTSFNITSTIDKSGNMYIARNLSVCTNQTSTETALIIGRPGGVNANEGGQLTLAKASGASKAAHLDMYHHSNNNDYLRVLVGTDTASTAATAAIDLTNNRFGIGTQTPATTIHVGSGQSNYVRIENAASGDVASGYQIYRGASTVGMSLYDNPADDMTTLQVAGGFNINANSSGLDFQVAENGLVRIVGSANTTGLCINETDVRISNNQTNYGKYKVAANAVTSGTAHLGRKCADGYSTNAIIAEYWGVEEVWAKGAIAYKRISSYDQGEFQWWLNATAAGTEVSSSDTKMRLERTGALHINGSLTQNASDERMKENITLIPNALEKVKQLRGVSFTWKEIENSPHEAGTEDIGVIAQDVEAVLPLIVKPAPFDTEVNTTDEGDEETKETKEVVSRSGENYKTVEYEKLVPLLIESIKELEARVAELEG